MASSIPEVSSVAWSSIITGTNPGVHGIYGFTDIAPGTYRTTFPNFNHLKAKPFWERNENGRSVIINVPTTFPAREINGVMIAGFVALDLKRATFPKSLVPTLEKMDYRVDVDSQKAHQSLDFFMRDLDKTLQTRIDVYRHLWHEQDWETFVLVFTGTDRLAHFLWDAYDDEGHKYHEPFLDHFQQIDEVIGEIAQALREDDILIMLSDHGFERLKMNVYINHLLQEGGFSSFEEGASPSVKTMAQETTAFALDPGRVYVHLRGRFPHGSVPQGEYDAVVDDLTAFFSSLRVEGERIVQRTYRREELYAGSQSHRAPDLVLLGHAGYNLRGNWKAKQPFGTDIFAGKHSQADAFLLVRGKGAERAIPDAPSVVDVVGIMDRIRESA
jgi:predicted AlkP superfamily phosphohydrolase/phosphomutase